jgi:hypothetical protein
MGRKKQLPKPTLAESKAAIVFGGAFLLLCLGEFTPSTTFHRYAQSGPI